MRAGFNELSLFLDEAIAVLRPDEPYIVLHQGLFFGSVRPETPPVPGSDPDW